MQKTGKLYVVATPLGHLMDITLRAVDVLKTVDRVLAEDTRHSRQLLQHFNIDKPLMSLHNFNESDRVGQVLTYLEQGEQIALMSDAGTPLISDPGFLLVRKARELGFSVSPLPGPCALIAALCVSGLPANQFIFEGFLPPKQEARKLHLKRLANEVRTIIFYEAPHRLLALLEDLKATWGEERLIVVAKELTKIHESVALKTIEAHLTHFKANPDTLRGEFVVLTEGAKAIEKELELEADRILDILLNELSLKQAVKIASLITEQSKNDLYERALLKRK